MRRLLLSRLIGSFTVCFVDYFFIPIIIIWIKQGCCLNLPDVRSYLTLPYFYQKISNLAFNKNANFCMLGMLFVQGKYILIEGNQLC